MEDVSNVFGMLTRQAEGWAGRVSLFAERPPIEITIDAYFDRITPAIVKDHRLRMHRSCRLGHSHMEHHLPSRPGDGGLWMFERSNETSNDSYSTESF